MSFLTVYAYTSMQRAIKALKVPSGARFELPKAMRPNGNEFNDRR